MDYFVYMFLNENESALYIGSTKTLKKRIEEQHFKSKRGNLSKECIEETSKILYSKCTSEDDMKIKERYLINTLNPKYNDKMNNENDFNFLIPIDWSEYEFNKEKLLKKREQNEYKEHSKFRNHNFDFKNKEILKINSTSSIYTLDTCVLHNDIYYPNIKYPIRNPYGFDPLDNFHLLKINNQLYIFCSEILNFYDFSFSDSGNHIYKLNGVEELNKKHELDTFIEVDFKHIYRCFSGNYMVELPRNILFMKYEEFKRTDYLNKEWVLLIDKAILNFKKPQYEWLLGRCLSKDEISYAKQEGLLD